MRILPAVKVRICTGIIISSFSLLPSLPSAQAQSTPVSDDFHSTSLNTNLWTVVNPTNDGSVTLNGTDAALRVPAGTPHDLWTGGNQSLRILQPAPNTDFQVEAKFDSIPTLANQDQGIIVQTDANNYLRFDIFSDGSSRHMFATGLVNNTPNFALESNIIISGAKAPFWIRVKRAGNVWSDSWSVDGINFTPAASFTFAMVVNQAGVFSGNCCGTTAPAFTAYVDYFFNSASPISPTDGGLFGSDPPIISAISATNVTSTAATVLWTTNQLSSSRVDYGTTTSYNASASNASLVQSHSVSLTGLTCNTQYHYKVSSTNSGGFTGASGDNLFTTGACGSPSGPTSDDFHSTSLSTSLWSVVNPLSDGSVSLNGTDAALRVPAGTPHDPWSGANQTVRILQATTNTDFQVEVKFDSVPTQANQDQGIIVQTDANNYLRFDIFSDSSSRHMFAASLVNNNPTVQSDLVINVATAPFWIRLKRAGNVWTDSWSVDGTNFTPAASFTYAMVVNQIGVFSGNCCSTTAPAFTAFVDYFFNSASPISPADGGMLGDTNPPIISAISANNVTPTAATVVWTTDQSSSSRVDYGTTTTYNTFVSSSTLVQSHSSSLTGLLCNTQYHYKVSSTNSGGFTGSSGDNSFTTGACTSPTGPISDDFHLTNLDTSLWSVVNPLNDGNVSTDGVYAKLSVPAGVPHDPWTGQNQALRLIQNSSNTDFQVELKFDSIPTLANQDQGLIVRTDVNNYLRFDHFFDGTSQHMFAASFVNNNPTVQNNLVISGVKAPFWLRVKRAGNVWTDSWSVDGTNFTPAANFTYPMVVNQMGPFVGNCCGSTSPAFTSMVDYFSNGFSPISVTASPNTAAVMTGQSRGFTALLLNDASNKGVAWSLSGAGCSGASCGALTNVTISSTTYTAPASVPSPASVTLTATSIADPTKMSSATITISQAADVVIAPSSATVISGATKNFTASVPSDNTNKGVAWTLSGAGCGGATCGVLSNVTITGVTYTAPASVPSPATVSLTATSLADSSKKASATITVAANVITVSISPKRAALTVSSTLSLTAQTSDGAGVTWSTAPAGGSFNPQTSLSGVPVTFTAPANAGAYVVTATSITDSSKSNSIDVGVTDLKGVFTYHNSLSREGVNSQEYSLTPSNVTTTTFGKLFSCQADAAIYAQPLWVGNMAINGGIHNVVVAVTMRDSVYVYDADASPCVTYWHKTLIPAGETYGTYADVGSSDIYPDIGILSTPVIDSATKRIYLVAKTKSTSNGAYHQRLHVLNLADGSEPVAAVDLTSSITVPGTGDRGDSTCGSPSGQVPFCPLRLNQRPGLALANGIVYVAWASHGDVQPYHGWVIGFNATTLARTSIYNTSPNGREGGIWMSGGAPAVDSSNNLYLITGNGDYDGVNDFGDTLLKLSTTSGLTRADFFTPSDQANLDSLDLDFGSGAAVVLVDLPQGAAFQHLVIGGGKGSGFVGQIYVLNRDSLGGYKQGSGGTDKVIQQFPINHAIFATPAFWQNRMYLAGISGPLQAYALNTSTSTFNNSPSSQSSATFRSSTPSISASGTSNGIVWALDSTNYGTSNSGSRAALPAILRAFDANNLGIELWNSTKVSGDAVGNAVKFTVPTVANGRVYVPSRGNDTTQGGATVLGQIDVYGLKPN